MTFIEETITTSDGLRLYLRRREAEGARGEVLIIHGFGEHSRTVRHRGSSSALGGVTAATGSRGLVAPPLPGASITRAGRDYGTLG